MKRHWKTLVGALVLVAGGVGAWRYFASSPAPTRFETVQVERGDVVAKVTASGTLSALVTVQVGSQVSGRIQTMSADFNSQVKKGQVIATIDPQLFEAAAEQSRANHVVAQANLTKAKVQAAEALRQAKRAETLSQSKLIAQADLDSAQAAADAAKAQVEAAEAALSQTRASLRQAEVNLGYTKIISPIDGIVISRNVDVGQTVAASFQAPTLFVIAEDLARMQVNTSVAEADIGKVQPGMAVTFTVDAYPGERFNGRVSQVRNAPQTVQNVVTYNAVIEVENPGLRLKPGMTTTVTFVYAESDDVLRVPNAALRFSPPEELLANAKPESGGAVQPNAGASKGKRGANGGGWRSGGKAERDGKRTVWILREGKPASVELETGISDGTHTEVKEGALAIGDALIIDAVTPGKSGAMGGPGGGGPGGFRRMF